MLKTIVILPDGTEISSGSTGGNAVRSVTITQCVNENQDLTLGSVCAAMLELELITPAGGLSLTAGEELTVYRQEGDTRRKVGIFLAEKPTHPSANAMRVTAYDRVKLLDQDLSQWLRDLSGWPYTLTEFARMVCAACGVELVNETLPNGDYAIQAFSAGGITGRQLMQWVGQIAGRFCRATADGTLEFAWYRQRTDVAIGPGYGEFYGAELAFDGEGNLSIDGDSVSCTADEEGNLTITSEDLTAEDDGAGNLTIRAALELTQYPCFSLSYEDYQVAPVEKVQLRLTREDVGAVYPDTDAAVNTYAITGNYLLCTDTTFALEPLAQTLYEQLKTLCYTPCKVSIPANMDIQAGDILTVTDRNGRSFTVWVMVKQQQGQRDTLECTGGALRENSDAFNERIYQALTGKVLELQANVEGLKAENRDAAGNLASLEIDLGGIRTQVALQQTDVESVRQQLTALEQTAGEVEISVENIRREGVAQIRTRMGYTFDDQGLKITREGQAMENLLDNTGMYVRRSGQVILQANDAGVTARDVTVGNYLVLGTHARLEDYSDGIDTARTACFWL